MALETVRVTAVLPAAADRVYAAWLDSGEHSKMTGGKAQVDPRVDGEYSAWDGYIHGKTFELEPGRRIVQSWRSTDFPLGHADSRLEVHLLEVPGGTEVTLIHTGIPEGQSSQYGSGWIDHYIAPMTKYFMKSAKPSVRKAPAKKAKPAPKKSKPAAKKPAKKVAARAPKKVARNGAKKRAPVAAKKAKKKGKPAKKGARRR